MRAEPLPHWSFYRPIIIDPEQEEEQEKIEPTLEFEWKNSTSQSGFMINIKLLVASIHGISCDAIAKDGDQY